MATPIVTLHTLGECRLTVAPPSGPPRTLAPDADRLFSFALLLAGEHGRPLPRGQVAAWLWPELLPNAARRALRQALYRLRACGLPVEAEADHLRLPPAAVTPTFAAAPSVDALRSAWAEGTLRLGRCLPGWEPAGDALAACIERYRSHIEHAARSALDAALAEVLDADDGAPRTAPTDDRGTARDARDLPPAPVLARALLELDPAHPVARRVVRGGRASRALVREPAAEPYVSWPQADRAGRAGRATHAAVLGPLLVRVAAARAGAGGLVVLTGRPPGAASALLAELARATTGMRVVTVDCAPPEAPRVPAPALLHPAPHTTDAPFDLSTALARALLACPGALGAAPAAVATARRAAASGPEAPRPVVAAEVLGELAGAVAEERPLLVCVDRAERADAASLAALAGAARAWGAAPVLAVLAGADVRPARGARRGTAGGTAAQPPNAAVPTDSWPDAPTPGAAARRWAARLCEVGAALAAGRPLLLAVDDEPSDVRAADTGATDVRSAALRPPPALPAWARRAAPASLSRRR